MCHVQSTSFAFRRYIIYGTMTSCVASRHHTCMGHRHLIRGSFCSFSSFLCTSGSPLPAMCSWCLMHVGHDASSASPGWSLLPSSMIIVLALVNSAKSHRGLRYLNETWECCLAPCQYCFHRIAVPFGWCP